MRLVANAVGDSEAQTTNPVNSWTGALILAIALDLGPNHAPQVSKNRSRDASERPESGRLA